MSSSQQSTVLGINPDCRNEQDVFSYVKSLLALREQHAALRTGKQWHIGWGDDFYAFLRETSDEKLLVVYNNGSKALELNIPIDKTPLESAYQLQTVFGNITAKIVSGKVQATLPAESLVVLSVH